MAQPKKINEPFFVFILHNTPQRFNSDSVFHKFITWSSLQFCTVLMLVSKTSSKLRFIYAYIRNTLM